MAIAFVCSCGKRLKARAEQAGRLTVCPRCGELVAVPSPRPADPDAPAPLTPQERRRLARLRGVAPDSEAVTLPPPPAPERVAAPADPGRSLIASWMRSLKEPAPRSRRRRRPLEARWHQCLIFPLYELHLWVGPALILALLVGLVSLFLPRLASSGEAVRGLFLFMVGLSVFFAVGYPCNYLGGVLADAAAGGNAESWSGHSPAAILKAGLAGVVCFLAGPIVPAAAAAYFWLHSGEGNLLDTLLLAELWVATVGLWLLVLAALADRGRLRDINPVGVIDLAHRLGWRALVVALIGTVLAYAGGRLAREALRYLHTDAAAGWALLIAFGLVSMYGGAFVLRLLGLWCYRTRRPERPAVPVRSGSSP
jgi:hypothetical protein